MVPGTLRPDELLAQTGVLVDDDGPYETLSGLVMDRLGTIPEVGDEVVTDDAQISVVAMQGRRITRLHVQSLTKDEPTSDGNEGVHQAGDRS